MISKTTAPVPLSKTTIESMAPGPSTTEETTTTAPAPSSYSGEETTNITEPELLMTTKTMVLVILYKDTNKDTNIYAIPSIGTAKETGLLLGPGGVTHDTSHPDNSSLSSSKSVSDI